MKPGDVLAGRFVIEALAGQGGMGSVFRALDHTTGEPVALKMLHGAAALGGADRFAREIRVLAALRHPGIVRYVADGVSPEGSPWLAMEWLSGESVAQLLAGPGVTAAQSVDLARRVAEALGAAHERGIVHRDVKPSNLFLPDGDLTRVKVLDFGVARLVDARGNTTTGVMVGTPGYMAPEQVRGERDVGPRCDVFAIGCLLFECLTGQPVYAGDHALAILAKILVEEPPRVTELRADLPDELDALVARMLARDPEARPRTGLVLAAELAALDLVHVPGRKRTGLRTGVLTRTERRLLCVVVIGVDASVELEDPDAQTITGELPADALASLRSVAAAHRGLLERLANGAYVVTVSGSGGAADHVVQAARCALALHAELPAAPMALATGRAVMSGRWPVGEAIDRAVALVDEPSSNVRIDEITGGLLDSRFEVGGDLSSLLLVAERDIVEVSRTLLGQVTPCVGRDRELAVLDGLYDECVEEPRSRVVLVTGAAGVGKSRIRYEMLKRAKEKRRPPEVWIGRGDALRAGSPFGMIAPALRRAAGILDGEPGEVRRHKLRARVQRNASLFTEPADLARTTMFLGELVGAPFPDDESLELRAARHDALLMTDQIQRAFEHFVTLETAVQPLVIVLEDLHWGDLPTTNLIDAALRALPDARWLVLALARPDVHELFPRLWAERGLHELRLGELSKKGSERLVRSVLGDRTSDTLVARIVEQAGGNSFYLEELIRAVADGKDDKMPETVLAVVQGRLDRLEVDARQVLRAAAVFGQQFWRGGVAALLGEKRAASAKQWLDELTARELIARSPAPKFPGEDEYLFRHAMVREAAYAMLTEADRQLGHKLAGTWLAKRGEADPMTLAEHFERGGERPRAAEAYQRAAEDALVACDYREAAARAVRGIACEAKGELLGALLLNQAEAHRWQGEYAPAAELAHAALALLPVGGARWFAAAGEVAETCGKLDDQDRLVAVGTLMRDAPDAPDAPIANNAAALTHAVFQLFSHGFYDLAQALLERVERLAGDTPDASVLARVHQSRSSRAMFSGDVGLYLESEHAAAEAFAAAGDRRYAFVQRGHVGYACLEIGAYADAERWLREALAGGEQLGMATVVATAKHNLGRALQRRGALAAALEIESAAIEMFAAQGDKRLEGAARVYVADILAELGDLPRAERELRRALDMAAGPARPQVLAYLARVQVGRGAPAEALASAREAIDTLEALGGIEEGESIVRLAIAEALAASGDAAGAREAAASARLRLLERASKISDVSWRASFTSRVPENARTLALAEELDA